VGKYCILTELVWFCWCHNNVIYMHTQCVCHNDDTFSSHRKSIQTDFVWFCWCHNNVIHMHTHCVCHNDDTFSSHRKSILTDCGSVGVIIMLFACTHTVCHNNDTFSSHRESILTDCFRFCWCHNNVIHMHTHYVSQP
jgi:hypothetical protein